MTETIVKNYYSKETVEQWPMYTLYKVGVKLMYTLYNDLTNFSKKWFKCALLQFLTMWILWDRKCEYGFFHITHAKNSSNHSSLTRDLTRFFGICDVEKPILTFPPHSILSVCSKFFRTPSRGGNSNTHLAKNRIILQNFKVWMDSRAWWQYF